MSSYYDFFIQYEQGLFVSWHVATQWAGARDGWAQCNSGEERVLEGSL